MKKQSAAVCVFIVLLVTMPLLSCGKKKEVKKEPLESRIATEAVTILNTVKGMYQLKETARLKDYTTEAGYKEVADSVKNFTSANLVFTPNRVEIKGKDIQVSLSWSGKWERNGVTAEEKGVALIIMKGDPPKIDQILRSNPFVFPKDGGPREPAPK